MFRFPSQEWVAQYKEAINGNPAYKVGGANWNKGGVSLICQANPGIGIPEDVGIWLDLHQGVCREARMCTTEEAGAAPFVITGPYQRRKQVIMKELDPIQGMLRGKLRLKGDLPTSLSSHGVPEDALPDLAEATLSDGAIVYNGRPAFDVEELKVVWKAAWDG